MELSVWNGQSAAVVLQDGQMAEGVSGQIIYNMLSANKQNHINPLTSIAIVSSFQALVILASSSSSLLTDSLPTTLRFNKPALLCVILCVSFLL